MGDNRKCISHWRREQEVKHELRTRLKMSLLEKEATPPPPAPSRARLSSYSGMRKASVAHKTTRLLPMLDPLVLSTEMMTLTHHLPQEKYLKIQRKGRKSQPNFRADS